MPGIVSAASEGGKINLPQKELRSFTYNLFSSSGIDIDKMISVFDNSNVENRHISVPVEWLSVPHTFKERNRIFIEEATALAAKVIKKCLQKAEAGINEIDNIIFITSTGLSTPTLDAILFNNLKFNNHIVRTPLWGLGCAGGASGISRAMDFTKAYPKKNALVIAVELCSLTFQKDDISKSNIVAASLFSDGAGAAIIAGDKSSLAGRSRAALLSSLSTIYENSLDVMGWDIAEEGFRVVFSRDIPTIVKGLVYKNIGELLAQNEMTFDSLKHFIAHPGGRKVIAAYEESIGLSEGALKYSRKVLKEHGNMSSPSVIFVLDEFLKAGEFNKGEKGLISSLGPGFSSELILFEAQ